MDDLDSTYNKFVSLVAHEAERVTRRFLIITFLSGLQEIQQQHRDQLITALEAEQSIRNHTLHFLSLYSQEYDQRVRGLKFNNGLVIKKKESLHKSDSKNIIIDEADLKAIARQ